MFGQKNRNFSLSTLVATSNPTLAFLMHNWQWILSGALILIGIILIMIGGYEKRVAYSSRIVDLRMENIGELSTQNAYFTNVQVISDSRELWGVTIPFTQSKYIFSYDGMVKAGINFKEITYSVNTTDKTISVNLPAAYITSVSVDESSLEIYDESRSIFTPLNLADFRESRLALETEAVNQAIGNGVLTDAISNAKILVQAFLLSDASLTDYTIVWHETEANQ